jgi:tetratricopeptide (TPR) repeat protein
MAPTLSFWDCGEFIACANTLGIPHPPGTPFFVVIGRLFIMLGLFKNIAMRTNFISVSSSALTIWVCYLTIVRASQRLPFVSTGTPGLGQIGIRIGALSASLILAFSNTYWFNSVETEVYAAAMLLMMLIIYLAIRWAEDREKGGSDKKLIFLTYLLFLSVSVHLTVFLVVPALFIFFILVDKDKLKDPLFWITWAILFSLAVPFYFMIGMVIPWVDDKAYWIWVHLMIFGALFTGTIVYALRTSNRRNNRLSWTFASIILFVAGLLYALLLRKAIPWMGGEYYWIWMDMMFLGGVFAAGKAYSMSASGGRASHNYSLAFALFLAAIVGYSTHLYIPIRASQHPAINENDPSTISSFESYIERKQYGQESMISRMLYRRGALSHQFGRYQNMGLGGYLWGQYTSISWTGHTDDRKGDFFGTTIDTIIFLLGAFGTLVGLYYALKKYKAHPMLLILMVFIISSVLLCLYLNFSDGTKPDPSNPGNLIPLEVRERDYFYTPAFVIFATMVGMGMAALLYFLGDGLRYTKDNRNNLFKYIGFGVVGVLILLMPLNPAFANYDTHDRSRDYAPADYAWNILQSCKPGAIIFTNGDNDTFPLWYLQEVEHVRQDVRIVNLSLLNTDWYIMQLKHQMGVKMYLDDDQIIWQPVDRRGSIIFYRPVKQFMDPIRKQLRYLTAYQDMKTGQVIRVQDQMIEQIAIANINSVPIYFSSSVPTSNRWTLDNRLIRQGIVMQVDPDTSKPRLDLALSDSLITKVYRYRGLDDIHSWKDENNVGLTTTFPERFSEIADAYKAKGDTATAVNLLWMGIKRIPYYHQDYMDLEDTYHQKGDSAMADSVKTLGTKNLIEACKAWPGIVLYHQFLGVFYYHNNMLPEAQQAYKEAYQLQPDNGIAFRLYRDLTARMGQMPLAQSLMIEWTRRHPEDLEIQNQLNRMR